MDRLTGVGFTENQTDKDTPVSLLVETDCSGDPAGPAPDQCMATIGTDRVLGHQ